MFSPTQLGAAFDRNTQIIKQQTAGLTHAESLVQLPFRANCMNWVLGHLVNNRDNVLKLLGATPILDEAQTRRYGRESQPILTDEPDVLPLETLLSMLVDSQQRLSTALSNLSDDELARETAFFGRRQMPLHEWLAFFYFHDTYHTGQTEILRQAAGKDDKVI
jgi:hypothetical protein